MIEEEDPYTSADAHRDALSVHIDILEGNVTNETEREADDVSHFLADIENRDIQLNRMGEACAQAMRAAHELVAATSDKPHVAHIAASMHVHLAEALEAAGVASQHSQFSPVVETDSPTT